MEITVNDYAKAHKLNRSWVTKMCRDGRIPGSRKIGRDWIIPEGAEICPVIALSEATTEHERSF